MTMSRSATVFVRHPAGLVVDEGVGPGDGDGDGAGPPQAAAQG